MRAVSAERGYLGDEVLVARVVRGDDGEDVPVVFLHDVKYDRGLLLDGGAKLKEHGVVVLKMTEAHGYVTILACAFHLVGSTHRGEQILLKEWQWLCNIIGANINLAAFVLLLAQEKRKRTLVGL